MTPPTPLGEVSDVLGVFVVNVERHDDPQRNGQAGVKLAVRRFDGDTDSCRVTFKVQK